MKGTAPFHLFFFPYGPERTAHILLDGTSRLTDKRDSSMPGLSGTQTMSAKKNRQSWNDLSEYYQQSVRISLEDVHYGPFSPGERDLRMIGEVEGLDVLEVGCGGGQNSIVLAKWGAKSVTGLDFSERQLAYARDLAAKQSVSVKFVLGRMEDLSQFADESFDLIASSHAMGYAEELDLVFRECGRVLRPNGHLVTCIVHPIQQLVWDALESDDISRIGCYFGERRDVWSWNDKAGRPLATFETKAPSFGDIVNGLIRAGFAIERVEEPQCYTYESVVSSTKDRIPYRDVDIDRRFIEIGRRIPFSFIVRARRT